ncbi:MULTISPECIES: anaerobic sulfatase maturase [unclassified Fusibacter]|uniref:anaerobic sulfatase maturase n=1 Tax=unclassified Fusibacter TaxID=2624464 RepID=UPI0019D7035B|nr:MULTISPECIES: anaerobic sulfatase maturase [unclassified Fusibacter]MCK8061700.1 anaerobic sulfatase maturase [Fusibacter sp. A2]
MDTFHLMAKPAGPACNLNCTYCFYLEKKKYYNQGKTSMSDRVLKTYIKKYIQSQKRQSVVFTWQGGEPTLLGLDFFRKVVKYQKQFKQNKIISNSLQTNGTLINDTWCRFLKKNKFLVGISLDGPEEIHNIHRKYSSGSSTCSHVEKAIKLLQKYDVDFNVLTTVNDINVKESQKLYDYYKRMGIKYIQFIPIVERSSEEPDNVTNLNLSSPEDLNSENQVTPWSVDPERYGNFLVEIFDRWVRNDIGKTFYMNFEWALSAVIHGVSGSCHFAKKCGSAGIVEHNGDVYSCDHYVYPSNKIGNILQDDLSLIFNSNKQEIFGNEKQKGLSEECINCQVLHLCYGGCPKHRFVEGQNYLCSAYKRFFTHIKPYAEAARDLIKQGKPLTDLMMIRIIDK